MEIYQKYGPALLRKCERMLKSREDAEDIVQALFTDLLKKDKTDVDLPYLYRATTNRCLSLLRNNKKKKDLMQCEGGCLIYPKRTLLDDRIVDKDLLIKLLDHLDNRSCDILVLRYFDDLTQDEIAGLMHISRRTVGSCLQKIQKKVKKFSRLESRRLS